MGIAKTFSALSTCALSYNVHYHIAAATRQMFALGLDDKMTRNESTPTRMKRDHNDECQLLQYLQTIQSF